MLFAPLLYIGTHATYPEEDLGGPHILPHFCYSPWLIELEGQAVFHRLPSPSQTLLASTSLCGFRIQTDRLSLVMSAKISILLDPANNSVIFHTFYADFAVKVMD